ncbi:hypothetical protein HMPREF0534_1145 [Limosilactobacillus reuteri CF48-3A]|uniref:CDP-diacylglycerol--glycerol-3-phosphate 3-phosphatidyltransferase n=3 Tax=Limosilactobacillus reuteri TaxID=1598 RepID=A0A1S9AF19_LIMRT|nr:hypothetical protein HMPREF0538_22243 [Limosilactobacillus reuteri SD2112]EEI65509.1 hypothetical protein HMPREF0534_1145 [Limosilactobacillus reuteri CF48-3A]MDA9379651.1 CDP-diacylglycerol--glycerol-3-phosphate 3-phosphatidyltransferase [Limosilactobacillus reuteri]PEG88060.1 CDP-diacylglycerol--glycerol-3-phosphate 3-phosphatidyltransferase [Lactobacillus sp. UMNPBX13]PEG93905.1 CDP-diacylglycerol--glycerol-3-phosphate 3-phosphatidyltransferase [Lactobacillus sp. UMNPBX10]PEH00404.1 CDP-
MVKVCKVGEHLGNIGNFCAPKIIIAVNLFDLIECAGAFNRKIFDYGIYFNSSKAIAILL